MFWTNAFHLAAATIAAIDQQRWQVELFFKAIQQNLKIKTFLGTSENLEQGSYQVLRQHGSGKGHCMMFSLPATPMRIFARASHVLR